MYLRTLFVAVFLGCLAMIGWAQPSPSLANRDSLEWATMDSSLIVRGVIKSIRGGNGVNVVTFRIDETLKGTKRKEVTFGMGSFNFNPLDSMLDGWVRGKKEILCFLVDSKRFQNDFPGLVKAAPLATHSGHVLGNLMELDRGAPMQAITMSFEMLSKPDDILRRTKAEIQSTPSKPVNWLRLVWAPSEIYRNAPRYWNGPGLPLLAVPIDSRLERLAETWLKSEDGDRQMMGVEAIQPFPSPEHVALVKNMIREIGFEEQSLHNTQDQATKLLGAWPAKSSPL